MSYFATDNFGYRSPDLLDLSEALIYAVSLCADGARYGRAIASVYDTAGGGYVARLIKVDNGPIEVFTASSRLSEVDGILGYTYRSERFVVSARPPQFVIRLMHHERIARISPFPDCPLPGWSAFSAVMLFLSLCSGSGQRVHVSRSYDGLSIVVYAGHSGKRLTVHQLAD